ncbi:MAG TPA: NUDIX domain-containing protein [Candidatus Saccharimonadales bacterium]
MRLYYLIGRITSPIQLSAFFIYNLVFHVPRARVLVWNKHGELLLVRNWGGKPQWGLPGGGVDRGESSLQAARRELYEEIGIRIPHNRFNFVGTFTHQYVAPIYEVTIDASIVPKKPHNPREIVALDWFALDSLPSNLSPLTMLVLKSLSKTS